jgi:hypothetical protein
MEYYYYYYYYYYYQFILIKGDNFGTFIRDSYMGIETKKAENSCRRNESQNDKEYWSGKLKPC